MRIINKKYLLIILLIGIILTGVVALKQNNKKVQLDNVILKQEVNNKTFAMYKEDDDNKYVKVEGNKFPDMYVLNLTKSKCIDNNGNELKNVLSYENDKVTITSGNTIYCYLYFDKSIGLEIKEKNPQGLSTDEIRGAMYRFQGQAKDVEGNELVDNYICFGTSDKDTCTSDTDHYMYRILGIEASTGRVKVIKKELLKDPITWTDNYDDDIEFPKSNIYQAINGNSFLTNTDYVPVNEENNINWKEKIATNTWMYGDMMGASIMGSLQYGEEIFKIETGQKEVRYYHKKVLYDGTATTETVDSAWNNKQDFKVSLMYLHDYYYAVGDEVICFRGHNDDICKNSWINLSANSQDNYEEYLMTRCGYNEHYFAYFASAEGYTADSTVTLEHYIRPVFYINAKEELLDGEGTLDDPFLIAND